MKREGGNWSVADSPHWRDGSSQWGIQRNLLIALLPAVVASGYVFGASALRVMGLAVAASVAFDALASRVLPSKDRTGNGSAVILGLLLAFILPPATAWWMVLVGSFLVVVVGKKLFGGWGGYPVHPVALGGAMLTVSWPARMDTTAPLLAFDWQRPIIEPMRHVKSVGATAEGLYDRMDLLLGQQAGGTGNAMVLWLLLGALFLMLVRQLSWRVPAGFVAGVLLCAWLLDLAAPGRGASPTFHLLAGGTVLAGFFLLPELGTAPVNPLPMLLYGLLGGVLLVLVRTFSMHSDGVIYCVLLTNLCGPLLDRIVPRVTGLEVKTHA